MISLLGETIDAYIEALCPPESELLGALRRETQASLSDPQMQVGRTVGQFLRLMVQVSGAENVLEIGTFSGYSSLCLASGLGERGRLITCEIDPEIADMATRYFRASPWAEQIELRLGPAVDTLRALREEGATFDLVFIDADKPNYTTYWELVLDMLSAGGIVLADNTLWNGTVVAPEDAEGAALDQFNHHVQRDDRVEQVLLSIRDGMMLARKK